MRFAPLAAFLIGTLIFAVLPIYAPPIVLQSDEIPRFLFGLGAAVVTGAALGLASGRGWGIPLVLSCALAGAIIYTFAYAAPTYGLSDGWSLPGSLILWTSIYTAVPAFVGAALSGFAASLFRRGRTSR